MLREIPPYPLKWEEKERFDTCPLPTSFVLRIPLPLRFAIAVLIIATGRQSALAQPQEYLISPDPAIGDTLDDIERSKYHLFPRFEGFRWAVFTLNEDKSLNAYVWTESEGQGRMITIRNYCRLSDLKEVIDLYDDEEGIADVGPPGFGLCAEAGSIPGAFPLTIYAGPTLEVPINHSFLMRFTLMAGGILEGRELILEDDVNTSGAMQIDLRYRRTRRSKWYGFAGLTWIKPFKDEIQTTHGEVFRTHDWWDIFHLTGGTGYIFGRVQVEATVRVAWFPNLWSVRGHRRMDYVILSAALRYIL